jgi:hypothetical protein
MIQNHRNGMTVVVILSIALLSACTTIPKQHFDAYQQSFAQVKVSTEDMLLLARVRTDVWASHPDNTTPVPERVQEVRDTMASLDDRQNALDTINEYNTVLIRLAAGEDPEAIEGSLKGIADGLSSFENSSLTAAVADFVPYAGVVAKLLAAIDDQAKREEVKRLVAEAQGPMSEVVDILILDAGSLQTIIVSEFELERNMLEAQIDDIRFRFDDVGESLKTSDKVDERYNQHNELRSSLTSSLLGPDKHTPGAKAASASDLEVLSLILDEERLLIEQANALTSRIEAQGSVTVAYVATLNAMNGFFVAMNNDFKQGKRQAAYQFVRRGLEFRKAIIEVREGV